MASPSSASENPGFSKTLFLAPPPIVLTETKERMLPLLSATPNLRWVPGVTKRDNLRTLQSKKSGL